MVCGEGSVVELGCECRFELLLCNPVCFIVVEPEDQTLELSLSCVKPILSEEISQFPRADELISVRVDLSERRTEVTSGFP